MSIQNALQFFQKVEADPSLRSLIDKVKEDLDLDDLVRIGAENGCEFTVEELRTAFARDWGMRLSYYGAPADRSSQSGRNSR